MNIQQLNEKYICLCRQYQVDVQIMQTDEVESPKQEIRAENNGFSILLNMKKIAAEDYEAHLAYNIGRVLLPRLSFDTKRLHIRRLRAEDAQDCFAFLSDAQGCMMDCSKPVCSMDEDFQERMEQLVQHDGQYAIVLKESGRVIGAIRVWDENMRAVEAKEIGYVISPEHRRKGYAQEALSALIHLLQKDLQVELLLASVLPENIASIALLEKLGFCREGLKRKAIWHEGLNRPVDLIGYYRDAF